MISVYLGDEGVPYDNAEAHFRNIAEWAKDQCPSFAGYNMQDVSDVSLANDYVTVYLFNDKKDAEWFTLKWK